MIVKMTLEAVESVEDVEGIPVARRLSYIVDDDEHARALACLLGREIQVELPFDDPKPAVVFKMVKKEES